jgi:hypothetical protein
MVSVSRWPASRKADRKAIAIEGMIGQLEADISHILKLAKMKPKVIELTVAPGWKFEMIKALKAEIGKTRDTGSIMKAVLARKGLRPHGKEISRVVPSLVQNPERIPAVILSAKEESAIFGELAGPLGDEFGCKVVVKPAEESSSKKASQALPGRPGIEVA